VADADYDCRRASHRVRTESPNRFFAASAILHSSPDPSSLALAACETMRCWHSMSAHSARMASVQSDRIGAGFRTSDKNAVQANT
jgi:hypothetical protein